MNEDETGSISRTHVGDENDYEKLYFRTVTDTGGSVIFEFSSLFWDVARCRLVVTNCIAWKPGISNSSSLS